MTPDVEEERVERTLYLLVGIFAVVPMLIFGTLAIRTHIWLGLLMWVIGVASAVTIVAYEKGWIE